MPKLIYGVLIQWMMLPTLLLASPQSLNELAKAIVPESINQSLDSLDSTLHAEVLPHDTKSLRKQIGKTKILLDLFVHTYPITNGRDTWAKTRKLFDKGYEVIGNFKDEFDKLGISRDEVDASHYDHIKITAIRTKALDWHKKLRTFIYDDKNLFYINNPSTLALQKRPRKDLPKYLWRQITKDPLESLSGIKNIALLSEQIVEKLIKEDYKAVFKIPHLFDKELEDRFHDFRKSLRLMIKLPNFLVEYKLLSEAQIKNPSFLLIKEAVSYFGAINDLLLAHSDLKELYDKNPDDQETASKYFKICKQIDKKFASLKIWQKNVKLKSAMKIYQNYFKERLEFNVNF